MKHRDRRTSERIAAAAGDLSDIRRMWTDYINAMAAYTPGIRSGLSGDETRSPGVSDPTAAALLATELTEKITGKHIGWRHDPMTRVHQQMLERLVRSMNDLETVRQHMIRTVTPLDTDIQRPDNQACRNPNCDEPLATPSGDLPLSEWCPPCHRYRAEHAGTDASRRTVMDRQRKRAERTVGSA